MYDFAFSMQDALEGAQQASAAALAALPDFPPHKVSIHASVCMCIHYNA